MNIVKKIAKNYTDTQELGQVFRIALPILLSNGSLTVMHVTDRLFLSKVGQVEIAAQMSGGMTSHVLVSFFVGLIGYASALVAQYYGANQFQNCTRSIIQALYVALVSYPLLILFIPLIKYVYIWTNQEKELSTLALLYARMMLMGCIFFPTGIVTALQAHFRKSLLLIPQNFHLSRENIP